MAAEASCNERIRITERAEKIRQSTEEYIRGLEFDLHRADEVLAFTKATIKVANSYLADKRSVSLENLKESLALAAGIIPDGPRMRLVIKDKYAQIMAGPEHRMSPVDLIEGGGVRSSVAFFFRKEILRNSVYANTLFLDEAFSTMNAELMGKFSYLIKQAALDMQIFVIEQHAEIAESGADRCIKLQKIGKTTVLEE